MSIDDIKPNQEFWKALFQGTDLVLKLMAEDIASPAEFTLPQYGKMTVTTVPAVPLGTNFMSFVFNCLAVLEDGRQFSAFVKVLHSNESRMAEAFIGGSYHRESAVYQEWLPELVKIKEANGFKDAQVPLHVAEPYYVNLALTKDGKSFEKSTVYVLQDLKRKGYRMNTLATTAEGIDFNHGKLAIEAYANYHALSIARLRQVKKADGTYNLSKTCQVFTKDPMYISPAVVYRTIVLPSYSKILRHFEENETADWLDSCIPRLDEIWKWESFMDAGTLTCLIHGDSWNNNVLFRYETDDSTRPLGVRLIDWQIARVGHPCFDLGYFFSSTTSSEFRREHLSRLLLDYFAILKDALSKLGIDLEGEGYDQDRFMQEAKERYLLGCFLALFILPILLDAGKAADHTLKDKETTAKPESEENDGGQAAKLDEEGTKSGWQDLFELKTVVANPLLSKRVVELLVDVRKMTH